MALPVTFQFLQILVLFIYFGELIQGYRVSEFKNKLKNTVKSKMEEIKSKLDPNVEMAFQKPDNEFPGNDLELVNQIRDSWDEYYDCLNKQNLNLGVHKTVTPEAIMKFEGSAVKFECKVCLSPVDALNKEAVVWNYRPLAENENGTREVDYSDRLLMSVEDKVLHVFNLQLDDSGQYLCQIGGTVTAPYFLEVVDIKEAVILVNPDTAPRGLHQQPPIIYNKIFTIFSKYYQWSPCNRCDKVGKRIRHGICTAILKRNYKQVATELEIKPASIKANQTLSADVVRETRQILNLFKKGIPCRSKLLPRDFRSLPEIEGRKSELMAGLCNVSCPHSVVFEVLDVNGEVIETANNSAGVYSTLQGIPPVPPAVRRRTMFEGSDQAEIVIKCPGNLNSEMPIHWRIGKIEVNSVLIKNLTNGRIHINVHEHIIIKMPRISDTNIYSCWQSQDLAGTVRLNVFKVHEMNAGQMFVVFTMILVMGTFLLVFYRAFKGRKRLLAR